MPDPRGRIPHRPRQTPAAGTLARLLWLPALTLAVLSLCACTGMAGQARPTATLETLFTVGTLQARLTAGEPGAWIGRRVRVRALAEPCPAWGSPHSPLHCATLDPILADPAGSDLADPLHLVVGEGNPLLAALRRVPLAGGLVPATPAPPWELPRIYSVRLEVTHQRQCDAALCFEAVLIDVRS